MATTTDQQQVELTQDEIAALRQALVQSIEWTGEQSEAEASAEAKLREASADD